MFRVRLSFGLALAAGCSVFSVGCITNKNKDVAVQETAPPPAAYPSSSEYPPAEGGTNPIPAASGSSSVASAPASAPAPFSLRSGEKLIPYQVASGDTLGKIATQYNTSVTRIKAANGMTNDTIYAGRTIQVPTSAPPGGLAMNTPSAPAPASTPSFGTPPGYGSSSVPAGTGAYPSTTGTPSVPSAPAIPPSSGSYGSGTIAPPTPPSSPGTPSVSYPSVQTPTAPPAPPSPPSSFPTPNLSGY